MAQSSPLIAALEQLRPHDHLCSIYDNREEHFAVAAPFIRLQQVVLNLMMNGIEAMNGVEDRPRELKIRTGKDQPDKVRVAVQDSGIGLHPDGMSRIFEAFYTTKPHGMGIGLSISRSIV